MILLALGTALAVVGLTLLADEWRRAGTQNARLNKAGLRIEIAVAAAVLIGIGVAIGHAGITS
jgi:hypothetical protein